MNILSRSKYHTSRTSVLQSMDIIYCRSYITGFIHCPTCNVEIITTTEIKKKVKPREENRLIQHSQDSVRFTGQDAFSTADHLPCILSNGA